MIEFFFIIGISAYLLLGLGCIAVIARSSKKKWVICLTILLLIPTWDVIIGYPVFWYLCTFKSGIKIYKTVDNVEGFYAGERYEKLTPWMPDKNYRYMDYRVKNTNQYYRSYWLDNNTSEDCYKPSKKNAYDREYEVSFYEKGRCFGVKPLSPKEVSQYEILYIHGKGQRIIPFIQIYEQTWLEIKDRETNTILAEGVRYRWNRGWLRATLLNVSGSTGVACPPYSYSGKLITLTLKPIEITKQGRL